MSFKIWLWKMKTKWRSTKYLLYDNKSGIPPVVGVYLLFALVGMFLYTMTPWAIVVLASIAAAYFLIRFLTRAIQNMIFSIKAANKAGQVKEHRTVQIIKGQPRLQTPPDSLWTRLFSPRRPVLKPAKTQTAPHRPPALDQAETQPIKRTT
jgi:hypothetical protein